MTLDLTQNNQYFISCPRECEELLIEEIKSLGVKEELTQAKGGVFIETNLPQIFWVVLQSRIASRIFLELRSFKFKVEDDIPKKVFPYSWH